MIGIADTGFLVASLNSQDWFHAWAVAIAGQVSDPRPTCEAALIGAAYLLDVPRAVLQTLASGLLKAEFNLARPSRALGGTGRPVFRSGTRPPRPVRRPDGRTFPRPQVITPGRKDFAVYRRNKRDMIPAVLPRRPAPCSLTVRTRS